MDREYSNSRTIYNRYVIDDGWNLPKEVIDDIELRIRKAWNTSLQKVRKLNERHKGDWITMEVACRYHHIAKLFLAFHDGQYVGGLRELGDELREKYGITELEAINILRGHHIYDYVNKYYRIKNLMPEGFDPQQICNDALIEYGYIEQDREMAM